MIVVAIISIWAAIVIPAYQYYTAKAQASEAVNLLGGLKTSAMDIAGSSSLATACSAAAPVAEVKDANVTTAAVPTGALHSLNGFTSSGKYVATIIPAYNGTNACTLTVTFAAVGINDKLLSKKVNFVYTVAINGSGTWACTSDLDEAVRPRTCTAA